MTGLRKARRGIRELGTASVGASANVNPGDTLVLIPCSWDIDWCGCCFGSS